MRLNIRFANIRQRLLLEICLPCALILAVVLLIFYGKVSSDYRLSREDHLQTIRDLRVSEVTGWLSRISEDMRIISSSMEVRRTGTALSTGIEPGAAEREVLRKSLNNYLQNQNIYLEFFIISAQSGKVVFSTNRDIIGDDRSSNRYLTGALRKRDIFATDIYYSKTLNIPTMTFSVPVYPPRLGIADPKCVLVARIYLERSLYSFLLDRTGLGQTGEVILFNKDLVAINKLKSDNIPPLTLKIRNEAVLKSLQGQTGIAEVRDFRGRDVLAAYTFIPSMEWGFIVIQDIEEALSPLNYTVFLLFSSGVVLIAILVMLAIISAGGISLPIRSFTSVARGILGGRFDERIPVKRDDEFGELAASFNSMADFVFSQLRVEKVSSDIIEVIVSTIDINEFSRKVIQKLMEVTESNIAAFYMLSADGREFRHFNSIGLDYQYNESFHAGRLEGEFGKALTTREITVTRNLDQNSTVLLKTVVGNVLPREIITVPIIVNNISAAVISLASLKEYGDETIRILNHIRPVMNTAYSNILAIEETRRLAQELQDKNQQLESKKETLESQALELKRTADRVRQQNIEMELQNAKVEEANKLKSQFLSNMSHELRTPLNSIMALSKVLLLQGKDKLNDEELDYIRIVSRNGEKLLMLINDILDLSKIEAGKIDLHPKKLSVKRIINMIMENFEQSAEEKGIELRGNFASELPDIMSDESRVYQIFQNIIGNAVKFTEEGHVYISAGSDDRHVRVLIEDTGIGIDEKDLPHIFEEFRQLDGTLSRKYEGTGLGLAIAVKSAELISGTISVESKRGGGSRFEVLLPVEWHGRYPENQENDFRDSAYKSGGEMHPGRGVRGSDSVIEPYREHNPSGSPLPLIAVIEDDPDNRTTIRAILKGRYRVIEASEGKTGIDIVYRHRPDLVLLDIALPGISGFTVVKEIKSNYLTRNIPVIALTALSMKGDRERILEAGCDDYLAKPYGVDQLLEKITFHLGTRNEHDPRY